MEAYPFIYFGCICQCIFLFLCVKIRRKFNTWSRMDKILILILYILASVIQYTVSISSLPENALSKIVVKLDVLSMDECSIIIDNAELTAEKKGGWQTARHKSYPTTDMSAYTINEEVYIDSYPRVFGEWLNTTVAHNIFPKIASAFGVDLKHLYMKDLFIVKYDFDEGQRSLPEHRDSSQITFSVALNKINADFEGGGTRIVLADDVINIGRGHMQVHDSGLYHAGHPITAGTRYIMVGFVNVHTTISTWWRSFGALASCVTLHIDSSSSGEYSGDAPVTITPLSQHDNIDQVPICRSLYWRVAYFMRKGFTDVWFSVFGDRSNGSASGVQDKPVGHTPSTTSESLSSIIVLVVLGVLLVLLVVVFLAMVSLCICGDDFNAYYCYYVVIMLAPLEKMVDPELATNRKLHSTTTNSSSSGGHSNSTRSRILGGGKGVGGDDVESGGACGGGVGGRYGGLFRSSAPLNKDL
jgi:hypothetical protein